MTRRYGIVLALVLLGSSASWALDGRIIMLDGHDRPCGWTVGCQEATRIYVWAYLVGASAGGITGAEYKLQTGPNNNADPGWLFSEGFQPGTTVLGGALTPLDPSPRGLNVAWSSCITGGEGARVMLQWVDVLNTGCSGQPFNITGVKHDSPSNQHFQCPLFTLCDAPVYTAVCVGSPVTTCRNPEPPFANDALCSTSGMVTMNPQCPFCCIAVEGASWTGMKQLYRD